jgi:hypothetical protein
MIVQDNVHHHHIKQNKKQNKNYIINVEFAWNGKGVKTKMLVEN